LFQTHPDQPLIIAANRDEFYGRASAQVELLEDSPRRIIGGRDLMYGGTWMGLNDAGLFVGLTNLRGGTKEQGSRGEVVRRVLRCADASAADVCLQTLLAERDYRPFNLLYGTVDALHAASYEPSQGLTLTHLEAGVHVMPSAAPLDGMMWPKVSGAMSRLEALKHEHDIETLRESLIRMLADGAVPSVEALPPPMSGEARLDDAMEARLQALYVQTPEYGTRSSTLVMLGEEVRYEFTEKRPSSEGFERFDALLTRPRST